MPNPRAPSRLLLLCTLALAACAKSSGPDQPVEREAEPSPFQHASPLQGIATVCAEGSSTEIPLDEPTEAGFAAQDVLAYAEGEHRETIRWRMPEDLSVAPESGASELTIFVERASDRAQDFKPDTEVIGHGARCRPWITIDVMVTIQSEGGALNERFAATLYATDPRIAYLHATTPALELAGALSVKREREGIAASSYELKMTFSEQGVTGALFSNWSRTPMEPQLYWDESFELAHWGLAHCNAESYSVDLDQAVELGSPQARASANAGIAWINAADPIAIAWVGGGTTTASLRFTASEDGACVTPSALSEEPFQDLHVRGELELRTEDGRVDARWPGTISINVTAGGAVTGATFSMDPAAMPDSGAASPAELGFPDESRGGHTGLVVSCTLWLDDSGENSGTIELNAYDNAGCDPAVDPSCGAAVTFTPLVRGDVLPQP